MRSIDEILIAMLADQAAAARRRQHYNLHADYMGCGRGRRGWWLRPIYKRSKTCFS